jgi:hypothetical protein
VACSPAYNRQQDVQSGYDSSSEYASDDTLAWFVATINDDSEDTTQTSNERSRPRDRSHCTGSDDYTGHSRKLSQVIRAITPFTLTHKVVKNDNTENQFPSTKEQDALLK